MNHSLSIFPSFLQNSIVLLPVVSKFVIKEELKVSFGSVKHFIPRRDCESSTEGGPIVFTYVLFCVRKRILDFKFTGGFLPFWNLENVLSPEGTSAGRLQRGPFVFTYVLFVLENVYLTFKKADGICGFWKSNIRFLPKNKT